MNKEDLNQADNIIAGKEVDIKGKKYVLVNDRVKAFRAICPSGIISTEIVPELTGGGTVTMKSTITDEDGKILATGLAQEKESNGYINKTSFIENCETSAVGRALGFAGIGIDESMASADEVATAIKNQSKKKPAAKVEQKESIRDQIISYCTMKNLALEDIEQDYHIKGTTDKEKEEIFKKLKERFGE